MPTLRLFVALYPPPAAAQQLLAFLPSLPLPSHKPTPLDQLHLTLLFIGETDLRQLPQVQESVERAASGLPAFTLTPQRLTTLPSPSSPRTPARLLACETSWPPHAAELQRRLAQRLARNVKQRDSAAFHPHITLARFSTPNPRAAIDQPLAMHPFAVGEVVLVQSVLSTGGAKHTAVMRAGLVP